MNLNSTTLKNCLDMIKQTEDELNNVTKHMRAAQRSLDEAADKIKSGKMSKSG